MLLFFVVVHPQMEELWLCIDPFNMNDYIRRQGDEGKSIFYRWLGRIFWLSAVAVTGYTWYYMDQAVPDRVSIIENEEEEFSFGLPLKATISSDSQEVALSNESNIPADQITISGRDHFSMFGEKREATR